jgi:putative ABC transport system substrate-binding protein
MFAMVMTTPVSRTIAAAATTLSLVVALAVLGQPLAALAQPTGKAYRIDVLSGGSAGAAPLEAFRQGLCELGWVEGRNIAIDYRFGEGRDDRLPELATQLVELKVDVIAAGPTPPAVAAKNATGTSPIVMLGAATPVELGLVASLARAGGNVTGSSWSVDLAIIGKGLELLKETVPTLRLVAILTNPDNPAHAGSIASVKLAARSLGVPLQFFEARTRNEFDDALRAMAQHRVSAVLTVADALFVVHRAPLADLEAKYRLPSMHTLRSNVEAGGLMSYGPDIVAVWRRAALSVDKILSHARRPVHRAADEVRNGHQPEDREDARIDDSESATPTSGRDHSVMSRCPINVERTRRHVSWRGRRDEAQRRIQT